MKRLGAALILTATLAFGAAACGGSEPSATEGWAGDVCSAVGDWQDQLEQSALDIREQIQSPGVDTLSAVQSEIQEAADAFEGTRRQSEVAGPARHGVGR